VFASAADVEPVAPNGKFQWNFTLQERSALLSVALLRNMLTFLSPDLPLQSMRIADIAPENRPRERLAALEMAN